MAIHLCPADCSRCLLAQSEQHSTIAKPSVAWFVFGGAIWPVVGLLSLPDILSADSLCTCTDIRIGDRGRLVGVFAEGPRASGADVLCRSPLEKGISWSYRWHNSIRRGAESI